MSQSQPIKILTSYMLPCNVGLHTSHLQNVANFSLSASTPLLTANLVGKSNLPTFSEVQTVTITQPPSKENSSKTASSVFTQTSPRSISSPPNDHHLDIHLPFHYGRLVLITSSLCIIVFIHFCN